MMAGHAIVNTAKRRHYTLFLIAVLMMVMVTVMVGAATSQQEIESESGFRHSRRRLPTMEDFLVENLDEIEPEFSKYNGKMYAGQLPINNNNNNGKKRRGQLMFWFFEKQQQISGSNPTNSSSSSAESSVTIWLNGGPGCSSLNVGAMAEHGPVTIPLRPAGYCCSKGDEPFVYNPYSWTRVTNMLYIEQPIGVGYSTSLEGTDDPQNEAELATDFFAFLQNWFRIFQPYQSSRIFLLGESFAGYYVPSIAHAIHQEMLALDEEDNDEEEHEEDGLIRIRLEGIGLGNGWADAMVQGPATIDYGYWHGMYDERTRQALHAEWDHCIHSSKNEVEPDPFHKFTPPDDCAMMVGDLMAGGSGIWNHNMNGPNTYDVTTWDGYPAVLGEENSIIEAFFNNPRVKEKLHAPPDVAWTGCIPGAGRRRRRLQQQQEGRRILSLLDHDKPLSTVPYLAELLDAGSSVRSLTPMLFVAIGAKTSHDPLSCCSIPQHAISGVRVLIYNGDRDLSTCAAGSEMMLNGMEWSGSDGWFHAPRGLWVNPNHSKDSNIPAGYAKSHKGLDFVVVYNSGHLVPYNQPENALDLIDRFLNNESFADLPLPDFDFYHQTSNPGTSLANGMYPIKSTQQAERVHGRYALLVLVAMALSFTAGVYSTTHFKGRNGYEKL